MSTASSIRIAGLFALLLALVLGTAGAGCGGKPSSVPIAPSTPWVTSLLGSPSHLSLVLRPSACFSDPYWGPALRRAMAKPSKEEDPDELPAAQIMAFTSASQMELFIGVRDFGRAAGLPKDDIGADTVGYVYVIRGVPGVDPSSLVSKRGERLFAPPVRLGSGVVEHAPSRGFARRRHGLATSLFVMPDGTWVGVDQVTATRARGLYASTAASPPPMTMESDGLLAAFVDRSVLETATRRIDLAGQAPWRQDLAGGGLVLYGGRDGAIELLVDYASESSAARSKDWIESELQATCRSHEIACAMVKAAVRDVKTSQDGRRVGLRFYLSELVLRKLSES